MKEKHPSVKAVLDQFLILRENCKHYSGIKVDASSLQCCHAANNSCGAWCAIDVCPLLRDCDGHEINNTIQE